MRAHVVSRVGDPSGGNHHGTTLWAAGASGAPRKVRSLRDDGTTEIRLDLRCAEGTAIDPHLVDQAVEVLAPHAVASDPQRTGGGEHGTRERLRRDERAVDVHAH